MSNETILDMLRAADQIERDIRNGKTPPSAKAAAAGPQEAVQPARPTPSAHGQAESLEALESRLRHQHDERMSGSPAIRNSLRRSAPGYQAPPMDPAVEAHLMARFGHVLGHRDPVTGQWSNPGSRR